MADQNKQVEMLFIGRTEVVVMDINIFNHLSRRFVKGAVSDIVDVHYIFSKNHYRLGFSDHHLNQRFNQALSQYKHSQDYRNLIAKYQLVM